MRDELPPFINCLRSRKDMRDKLLGRVGTLEVQFSSDSQYAVIGCASEGRCDLSKVARRYAVGRDGEIWRVGQVEGFASEFELKALPDWEGPGDSQIEVTVSRAPERIAPSIAEARGCYRGKGGGVEPGGVFPDAMQGGDIRLHLIGHLRVESSVERGGRCDGSER